MARLGIRRDPIRTSAKQSLYNAAAVMVDGRIVLQHNAARLLCACSTFKVAAATAVMALVQEETIDLDRPVLAFDVGVLTAAPWAGLSYEDLLRTRVLAPLAMRDILWRPGLTF